MVQNFPTTLHRIPEEAWQANRQQLSLHLLKILRFSTTHLVQ